MYLTFFGFREKPFNLTPDPKFLYLNASYREALASLRYGINERKGFVSLVGEAGTGKTTLLRRLLAELGPDVRSVLILNPAVGFDELLVFILTDLGHPPPAGTPKLQLLQALNAELLDTLARGGNVVVLIDEAQDLSIPVLEELRLLSNLETAKEKILQFVLAGQPELDGMLARPELRQLRQRIAVPARLRPLARGEVAAYVAARIAAAGGDARGLFTSAALRQLYRFSRGVPRLVNVASDSALVTAYAAGTRLIDRKIMREAIHDLRRGPYQHSGGAVWRARFATIAVAGILGAAMGVAASRLAGRPVVPWRTEADPTVGAPSGAADRGAPRGVAGAGAPTPAVSDAVLRADAGHGDQRGSGIDGSGAPFSGEAAVASPPGGGTPVGEAHAPPGDVAALTRATPAADVATAAPVAPAGGRGPGPAATPLADLAAAGGVEPLAEPTPGAPADAVLASAPAAATPAVAAADGGRSIFVQEGDDLTHIARRNYGYVTQELLEQIQRANPGLVNLDIVMTGQTIVLPPAPQLTATPAPADASRGGR